MDLVNQILEKAEALKADGQKFYEGGNKSAGTRTRKTAQDLKNLLQELRKDISAKKNEE